MPEYIEREALQDALMRKQCGPANKRYTEGWNDCLMRVKSMVSNAHTADVTPVVHGRWFYHDDGVITCSECGNAESSDSYYCRYCGAKMDGGADHDANRDI